MPSTRKIKLAISTCPNDTFAFHGIIEKQVDLRGIDFDIRLLDIQQLNEGLFRGEFDVAKASFHAAARLADRTVVLPSGSALGFGVGPLLLAGHENTSPASVGSVTLCPGEHTTATLLFRLFYGSQPKVQQVLFSEIMPTLKANGAQFGVCIHEGRFTWKQHGLVLVADLGTRWEQETSTPLPLGGILASRTLPDELIDAVQTVIQDSVTYGHNNRHATLKTMRKYAQEFDDDVLYRHVDLYVNDWTVDLGDEGSRALKLLSQKAKSVGVLEKDAPDIEVWRKDRG